MKKILDFSVKEFILFVTQIIAILFFIAVIILLVGADTFYFRSVITLIPIGIALVGARIAYKNYQAGQSERRNNYLKETLIDTIVDNPIEIKFPNSNIDVKFTLDNFPSQLYFYNENIERFYKILGIMTTEARVDYEADKYFLVDTYQKYLKSIGYILYQGIQKIKRIVGDELLLPNHKEELLELLVNRLFLGYLKTFNDFGLLEVVYHKEGNKMDFNTEEIHPILLPNKDDFNKAFGKYYSRVIENGGHQA